MLADNWLITPLYLLIVPSGAAALALIFRRWTVVAGTIALCAMALTFILGIMLSSDSVSAVLTLSLQIDARARVPALALLTLLAFALVYHLLRDQGEFFPATTCALAAILIACVLIYTRYVVAAALLQLAHVVAAMSILGNLPTHRVGATVVRYTLMMALGGALIVLGLLLVDQYRVSPETEVSVRAIAAVLEVGFGTLIAAAPLYFWMPDVAYRAPVMSFWLIAAVLHIATTTFLVSVLATFPWITNDPQLNTLAAIGGLITVVLGALLAFSSDDLRGILGYSAVSASGFVIIGIASRSALAVTGILYQTIAMAVALLLLAVLIGVIEERLGGVTFAQLAGLATRAPFLTLAFVVGGFSIVGVPGFASFPGRWLVFQAASQQGEWFLFSLLAGSGLLVLAYARALRACLRPVQIPGRIQPFSRPGSAMIFLFALICFGLGIYPSPIFSAILEVVSELSFVRAV
jgi:NADH:ubiquinone oxidoreductase subunit 2 (subunit N)